MSTVAEKMKALGAQRSGGKGTPRRKVKKQHKPNVVEDKKLSAALKKLNTQNIGPVDEVNLFKTDGSVIHFSHPKVQASIPSNAFIINGNPENKDLTDVAPSILNQLGPDSLSSLRRLAEAYKAASEGSKDGKNSKNANAIKADDEEVPALAENSEDVKEN